MARPRVITLEQGEVSLQGFPKEVADALVEHIKAFGQDVIIVPPGQLLGSTISYEEPKSAPSLESLPSRAIGVFRDGPESKLVTLAYNIDTKQALVTDIKDNMDASGASMAFKVAADRFRFIK